MAVNVRGTMLCYKHAGKQMVAQGRGGRIIGAFLLSPPLIFYRELKSICRGLFTSRKTGSSLPFACATTRLTSYEQAVALARRIVRASLLSAVSHKLLARPLPK